MSDDEDGDSDMDEGGSRRFERRHSFSEGQPISKEGYLKKKGGGGKGRRRNWKRRWFVLRGVELIYVAKQTDVLPKKYKGVIPLKNLKAEKYEHPTKKSKKNKFLWIMRHTVNTTRIWYLESDDEDDRRAWIDQVNAAATLMSRNKHPALKRAMLKLGVLNEFNKMSAAEIKSAYKKKSLELHPDRGGDAEQFKAMQESFEVVHEAKLQAEMEATEWEEHTADIVLDPGGSMGLHLIDYGEAPLNRARVKVLVPDKPAAITNSLMVGDLLVKVQHRDVRGIPFEEVMAYMRAGVASGIEILTIQVIRRLDKFGGPLVCPEDDEDPDDTEKDDVRSGVVEDWRVVEEEQMKRADNQRVTAAVQKEAGIQQ